MRDPDGIYLLKIKNRNTRTKSEIYSKLIIKKRQNDVCEEIHKIL